MAFAASERVLVDELPQFVSVIGNRGADKHRRMVALGQIAKSLAYVANTMEIMLLSKFDETGYEFLEDAPHPSGPHSLEKE